MKTLHTAHEPIGPNSSALTSRVWRRWFLNRSNGMIVVVGSVCWDENYRYSRGGTNKHTIVKLEEFTRTPGGAGANVSLALRKLRQDVRLFVFGNVGGDENGRAIQRFLGGCGVKMPLPPVSEKRTSVSFCFTDDATDRSDIFTIPGARLEPIALRVLERYVRRAKALVVTAPTLNDEIPDYLEIAHRHAVPVYMGLGSRQIFGLTLQELGKRLVYPVELVICNNEEAEHLVGSKDKDRQLEALSFGGKVRIVVITAGENGLYALADGQRYDIPAYVDPARRRQDDVGCGDGCQSAVIDALLKGYSIELALKAGARQGFEVLTVPGAGGGLDGDQMAAYLDSLARKVA